MVVQVFADGQVESGFDAEGAQLRVRTHARAQQDGRRAIRPGADDDPTGFDGDGSLGPNGFEGDNTIPFQPQPIYLHLSQDGQTLIPS